MTAFVPTQPPIEIRAMGWMELPRHYRRVTLAAQRAGACDERDLCDDWIMHDLKRCRHEALRAGHTLDEVNDWTMAGMLAGRQGD